MTRRLVLPVLVAVLVVVAGGSTRMSSAAFTATANVPGNTITADRLSNYFAVTLGSAVRPGTSTPVASGNVDTLALDFGTAPSVGTFTDPYQPGRLVTHRIAQTIERSEGRAYRTKGDANPARDPWTISLPAQAAQVGFDVPLAGYLLWYSKTREVRFLLVVGTALLLLASVLRTIWRKQPGTGRTA